MYSEIDQNWLAGGGQHMKKNYVAHDGNELTIEWYFTDSRKP
jgi:hypothetical protein